MSTLPTPLTAVARDRYSGNKKMVKAARGVVLIGGVAFVATELGKIAWFQSSGISALTLAIVLGMFVGNTVYPRIAAAVFA